MMKNTEEKVRGIGHTVRHSDMFFFFWNPKRKKKENKVETKGEEIRVQDFPELMKIPILRSMAE